MAFGHGKNGVFKLTDSGSTKRNISASVTQVSFSQDGDTAEVSTLGASAKSFIAGLSSATLSISGYFDPLAAAADPSPSGSHTVLSGLIGTATTFEIAPQGTAGGSPKITGSAFLTKYNPTIDLGGAVGFSADFQVSGAVTYTTY